MDEEVGDRADGEHAGQGANAPRRLGEERRPLLAVVVGAGQVHLQQQHSLESKPRLTDCTRTKLRIRRPAPDISTTASAISATTSP